jgi:hypothetical protein
MAKPPNVDQLVKQLMAGASPEESRALLSVVCQVIRDVFAPPDVRRRG